MDRVVVKKVTGGVTAPRGFLASGMHAGLKKEGVPDLALLVSEQEGPIAGVFTTNQIAAAPVLLGRQHLRYGRGRAIIINSGNANAFTGTSGFLHAKKVAGLVAKSLRTPVHTVFVGSTGVISQPPSFQPIQRAVPILITRLSRKGATDAATAILTTDTHTKQVAFTTRIGGQPVTVGGMAKGSGMIHPDMATMLAFLTTDMAITQPILQQALITAVDRSFHRISVDGDTSTNDTVLCLANGTAGNPVVREGSVAGALFQRLLNDACRSLALQICQDGEGVTKVVKVEVTGARSPSEAKQVARTIGTSNLVKTALFGEDANWGRIIAAIGRSGVSIKQNRLRLAFDGVPVVRRGTGIGPVAERKISRIVRRKKFTITVDLGLGRADSWLWTTDLSYDYVRINASYRT